MKAHKGFLSSIILVLLFSFSTVAQKNYTQEADEAFKMHQYYNAINFYKKAYSKVGRNKVEKKRILFQMAECYRLTNDFKKSEGAYRRVIKADYHDPIAILHLANTLKILEEYESAAIEFENYRQKVPDDPRGSIGVESCTQAKAWKDNPKRYRVENMKKMNSKQNDFSPAYADKKYNVLIFTSTRDDVGGKLDPNTGESFSDILVVTMDKKGNWSAPVTFDEEIINSTNNEGAATFNNKFNTIYFTRCLTEKRKQFGCEIYEAQKKGRTWGDPEVIPLVTDSSTCGHPAVSRSERELYFASDMPGGFGGKDIWMATRSKKTKPFENPVNLGPVINTIGDEMYPYLLEDEVLFFSSTGHMGMGGLDIFSSKREGDQWATPENMQYPINSAGDDFGIIFNLDKKMLAEKKADEMGFFSSNRSGGRGGDDIYEFLLPEIIFTLSGIVKDDKTLQLLRNAEITMSGSDGTLLETKTDDKGFYRFNKEQILKESTYSLNVQKKGYFGTSGKETTVGRMASEDLILNFTLIPIPPDPIPLPEIRFDLAKWDLKPQYRDSLNDLLAKMNINSTIVIELAAHTDIRADDIYNDTLSFKRARSCMDYLVEKGIDPDRIIPKGYGERKPRAFPEGYTYPSNYLDAEYRGISFPRGTVMTEAYINSLKTTREKEAAHQLNRRVEFRILHDNYVPKASNDTLRTFEIKINPEDNIIPLIAGGDTLAAKCVVIGTSMAFKFDEKLAEMTISEDQVYKFLKIHKLGKTDFVNKDKAFDEDGNIKENEIVILKKIDIGPKTLTNVRAKIIIDQEYPIVLGDKTLSKFGAYNFNTATRQLIFE